MVTKKSEHHSLEEIVGSNHQPFSNKKRFLTNTLTFTVGYGAGLLFSALYDYSDLHGGNVFILASLVAVSSPRTAKWYDLVSFASTSSAGYFAGVFSGRSIKNLFY